MKTLLLLLLTLVSAQLPAADRPDITLNDGRTLKSAKVLSKTPSELVIMHSNGVENVKIDQLPDALRKQYDLDHKSAEAYQKEVDVKAKELSAQEKAKQATRQTDTDKRAHIAANTREIRAEVYSHTSDGLIVYATEMTWPRSEGGWTMSRDYVEILLVEHPRENELGKDEKVHIKAYRDGNHTFKTNSNKHIQRYVYLSDI